MEQIIKYYTSGDKSMENFVKCIILHQSIINDISDKTPMCVQNMIKELQYYIDMTYEDAFNNTKLHIKTLSETMLKYYDIYFTYYCGQNSQTICDNVYKKIMDKTMCFQGGYGHKIWSSWRLPCHWCVKPEYYNDVKLNSYELLALKIHNQHVTITEKPASERWGN